MIDLTSYATNLKQNPAGVWIARNSSSVDYPSEGNAFCFAVEEGSYWFKHRNAVILEALKRYPPLGAFFDIGGGNGYVSLAVRQAGIPTVLVEPGADGIRNARQRGLENLVQASLEDAEFISHAIPAAGMFDVLEHIQDDRAFLLKLHALLSPGGRLYLTVPAYQSLWSSEDEYALHYRRYNLDQIKQLLIETGYQVEFSTYFFAILPLPIFLLRTLPTLLNLRKQGDSSFTRAELNPGSSLTNTLLDSILRMELSALKKRKSLPFGGSCLLVACSLPEK